ncbi:hypothetical protein ACFSTA_15420 [Ornithinibacillus salinisoli]|uniref:Uncharacterized protein n=1 Tax=Ornithinibacillus salinisoli TaxID=1848459 RepID=A0ABW4W2Y5_9BACI
MNQKDFAFIALRIFACYLFIKSFMDVSHIVNYYVLPMYYEDLQELAQSNVINLILVLGPVLVQILISIVVWLYAEKFSRFVIPKYKEIKIKEESNQNEFSLTAHQFQVAAVSIVGLVFIVYTLPTFFSLAQSWISLKEVGVGFDTTEMKRELLFAFLEKLLRLILGIVLFFGSKGIVGLLRRIREF